MIASNVYCGFGVLTLLLAFSLAAPMEGGIGSASSPSATELGLEPDGELPRDPKPPPPSTGGGGRSSE